jgi:hypothetical protein
VLSATPREEVEKLKKLFQKIKNILASRRRAKEIDKYIKSIPRDEKGRWIFPDKVEDTPTALLSSQEWINVKRILSDKKTWEVPCMCDMVVGKCVC